METTEEDSLYMEDDPMRKPNKLVRFILKIPDLMGTTVSIFLHTLFFLLFAIGVLLGLDADRVMLFLTTIISIEAIYLCLFIQLSVNQHHRRLKDVEEDIDDILEDTKELTEEDL